MDIVAPLLQWYDAAKRDLPWRHNPTPYGVWVSEIMLQQTRVEAVIDYYGRWMAALPTVYDLAAADEDLLHKLWEGLGYYSRVHNLHRAARIVVAEYRGVVPFDPAVLVTLPGIGDYTAGAIASIAYGVPVPAVDGNVLRVLARLLGDDTDILTSQAHKNAAAWLAPIVPKDRAGDFTQAMFEWGALLCTPKKPACDQCPLRCQCVARQQGLTEVLPRRVNKTKRKQAQLTVLVCRWANRYLLTPPQPDGLLAGMYGLPRIEGALTAEEVRDYCTQCGWRVISISTLPDATHIFSHITWRMRGYAVEVQATDGGLWVTPADIRHSYALPSAYNAYKPYLQ